MLILITKAAKNQKSSALNKPALLFITGFGNLLELFNFTLFVLLVPFISKEFFPFSSGAAQMMLGYMAFALSFLVAPFGSIFWGYIGDKYGSASIFKISLFVMVFPSIGIFFLPGFEKLGYLSIAILMFFRIVQGISASGEVLGSKIYAIESLREDSYLLASGFITAMGALGVLLSAACGHLLTTYSSEYWRVPFLVSAMLLFIVGMLRRVFLAGGAQNKKSIDLMSSFLVLYKNKAAALVGFVLSAMLGAFSYYMHAFMFNFQVYGLNVSAADAYSNIKIALFGTIISALLCSIIKRFSLNKLYRHFRKLMVISIICFVPMHYFMMNVNLQYLPCFMFFIGALLGSYAAYAGIIMIMVFSKDQRCRGALIVNAFGVAIFGGVTPMIMLKLMSVSLLLPSITISLLFLITLYIISKVSLKFIDN